MIKKGINGWSFPSSMAPEDMITLAKKSGFQGIEFCLAEKGQISLESSESELKKIAKSADGAGIEICSLASWLPWDFPLTSDDPKKRLKAYEILEKQIETAKILGTDKILVVPGYVGADFIENSEVIPYEDAYKRAWEAIHKLKTLAESRRIYLCIENVWNKFLLSPLEMRAFIDSFNSPYVGAYFDVANVLSTGYPQDWIRILGTRIKAVHFKDYRRTPGGFNAFVDLLAGDVDYMAVEAALREISYEGFCTAEMMPIYKQYSEQIVFNTSLSMDKILTRG